jgi:flagellar biosynthesis/type III secretory pathway M-ring protein FliF/YscJ
MEILINAPLMPRSVLPGIGELPGEKRIARISATVVLDRQKSSKEYETVTATIEKALNLDPARGDRLTVLYLPFDRTQELRSHQEAQARERKEFWTNIAINVAKLLGIIAAMITLRFIIQAVGRGVEMRGDHS